MVGRDLHEYDKELCEHALGNVRQHLGDREFAAFVRKELDPALRDYLWAGLDPAIDREWLPLSEGELHDLSLTFQCGPAELDRRWEPCESLHRRHVRTLREVREALSGPAAEEWSRACASFGGRLSDKRVSLADGMEIVREWVRRLRELLRAMGAAELLPHPEGRSLTPTSPKAARILTATNPAPVDSEAVERMRQAIRELNNGQAAKADALIKSAGINRRRGREALRWLQSNGEYDGFARKKPCRYAEGNPMTRSRGAVL